MGKKGTISDTKFRLVAKTSGKASGTGIIRHRVEDTFIMF